jgi:iron complex outermembrane receptor protein
VNDRPRNYYENDKYFNREANRFLQTLFAGYSGSWKNWLFSAGLSTTNSREYGLITNYGIDASYYFDNDLSVFGSWNTASRLPTFTDLYYKSATQTANPDLKPEFSKTLETGVKYSRNRFNVSGSLFFRQGTDIIDWVKYPDQTKWVSQNITGLNTFGAEVTAAYDFKNSALRNIGFSWNYLISDKNQAAYDSKYALDYLRNQMKFQLTHAIIKRIDMTWNLAYNDRAGTYADFSTGNQTNYQPYLTMGTRVGWKLGKWLIYADVNNLFNQECVDFGGLPLPGINGMMGIQWKLW